jgi:hypothetical protein
MWINIRLLILRRLRRIAWRTGLVVRETPCIPLSAVLLTSIRYAHVAEEIGDTPVSARLEIRVVGGDAGEVVAPWKKVVCVVCELGGVIRLVGGYIGVTDCIAIDSPQCWREREALGRHRNLTRTFAP